MSTIRPVVRKVPWKRASRSAQSSQEGTKSRYLMKSNLETVCRQCDLACNKCDWHPTWGFQLQSFFSNRFRSSCPLSNSGSPFVNSWWFALRGLTKNSKPMIAFNNKWSYQASTRSGSVWRLVFFLIWLVPWGVRHPLKSSCGEVGDGTWAAILLWAGWRRIVASHSNCRGR